MKSTSIVGQRMKCLTLLFAVAMMLHVMAIAAPLGANDAKALEKRAKQVSAAFDAGDAEAIAQMTHPSLFKMMGGREKMVEITKNGINQLKAMDAQVVESELGVPTEAHTAADEIVCFYPRTTVMRIGEKRMKSTGFLICVRKAEGGEWLFLDGSGLHENPGLLRKLLPAVPPDVTPPVSKVEMLN
jgi:hypothetical protein